MKNNIDKLTDTEILELAGYTKHMHILIMEYEIYISNLIGKTTKEASIASSISRKMVPLKSGLLDLVHVRATEIIKNNSTIDSIDLFYGEYNKKYCLMKDFIKGSKQSHLGLPEM